MTGDTWVTWGATWASRRGRGALAQNRVLEGPDCCAPGHSVQGDGLLVLDPGWKA